MVMVAVMTMVPLAAEYRQYCAVALLIVRSIYSSGRSEDAVGWWIQDIGNVLWWCWEYSWDLRGVGAERMRPYLTREKEEASEKDAEREGGDFFYQ